MSYIKSTRLARNGYLTYAFPVRSQPPLSLLLVPASSTDRSYLNRQVHRPRWLPQSRYATSMSPISSRNSVLMASILFSRQHKTVVSKCFDAHQAARSRVSRRVNRRAEFPENRQVADAFFRKPYALDGDADCIASLLTDAEIFLVHLSPPNVTQGSTQLLTQNCPERCSSHHSYRSASIGSRRAALRAG